MKSITTPGMYVWRPMAYRTAQLRMQPKLSLSALICGTIGFFGVLTALSPSALVFVRRVLSAHASRVLLGSNRTCSRVETPRSTQSSCYVRSYLIPSFIYLLKQDTIPDNSAFPTEVIKCWPSFPIVLIRTVAGYVIDMAINPASEMVDRSIIDDCYISIPLILLETFV